MPVRVAAWNRSKTLNRISLTTPTRRLACPSCARVFLALTPIIRSLRPWRGRDAFVQYWRPLDTTLQRLLGHLVTVFDFANALATAVQGSTLSAGMSLVDITDSPDGLALLQGEEALAANAPSVGGYEFDPTNPVHRAAVSLVKDVGAFSQCASDSFMRQPSQVFLYGFAKSANGHNNIGVTGVAELQEEAVGQHIATPLQSPYHIVHCRALTVAGRAFALYGFSVQPAVPLLPDIVAMAVGVSVVLTLLFPMLTYFATRSGALATRAQLRDELLERSDAQPFAWAAGHPG